MVRTLIALFLAFVLLAACTPQTAQPPPDEVTVQLKWVHQAQFAGIYVAQEKGYYAQENIKLTLGEGGPGINVIEQIIAGQADLGVAAPEDILIQRSQGADIVALATIFRRNPTVFMALPESGITRPADLLGKRVSVGGVVEFEMQLNAMFEKLALDIEQIEIAPHSYDLAPLYDGDVDSTALYSTGGLIRARQEGYEFNLIWPDDYGVHMYADTLITTGQMVRENPDLVLRFLRATLRGWQEAIEDTEMAVEMTMRYAREDDPAMQAQMMSASMPLIHTGEDHIGWMRLEIWQAMYDILLEQGMLDKALNVDEVYTMKFLQQIYEGKP